jgi:hypothetical protein
MNEPAISAGMLARPRLRRACPRGLPPSPALVAHHTHPRRPVSPKSRTGPRLPFVIN